MTCKMVHITVSETMRDVDDLSAAKKTTSSSQVNTHLDNEDNDDSAHELEDDLESKRKNYTLKQVIMHLTYD